MCQHFFLSVNNSGWSIFFSSQNLCGVKISGGTNKLGVIKLFGSQIFRVKHFGGSKDLEGSTFLVGQQIWVKHFRVTFLESSVTSQASAELELRA